LIKEVGFALRVGGVTTGVACMMHHWVDQLSCWCCC
jgi:hypothetical protein